MSKHLVAFVALVEVEDSAGEFDWDTLEDVITDNIVNQLDGEASSFSVYVPNPEYDEMALIDEPTEEEKEDGYYQASGNEAEEEIATFVEWEIADIDIAKVEHLPYGDVASNSVYAAQKALGHIK